MEGQERARGRGGGSGRLLQALPRRPAPTFSGPGPRTSTANYTSRQDVSARTRTGASTMATVLSRALKLPGKLQPRDHPAHAGLGGLGTPGSRGRSLSESGPSPSGAAGERRRDGAPPAGWGPRATRGQKRRLAGRRLPARGEPGKRWGKDPEGAPGWWPGAAAAADVWARVAAVPRGGR